MDDVFVWFVAIATAICAAACIIVCRNAVRRQRRKLDQRRQADATRPFYGLTFDGEPPSPTETERVGKG